MSIASVIDRAALPCTCCRVRMTGGRSGCDCWTGEVDACDRSDGWGCAEHCPCTRCKTNRRIGWLRVNWTGTRHFARVGEARTICGARINGPGAFSRPMLRPGLRDECKRCVAAWERQHASKENDERRDGKPPHAHGRRHA